MSLAEAITAVEEAKRRIWIQEVKDEIDKALQEAQRTIDRMNAEVDRRVEGRLAQLARAHARQA